MFKIAIVITNGNRIYLAPTSTYYIRIPSSPVNIATRGRRVTSGHWKEVFDNVVLVMMIREVAPPCVTNTSVTVSMFPPLPVYGLLHKTGRL